MQQKSLEICIWPPPVWTASYFFQGNLKMTASMAEWLVRVPSVREVTTSWIQIPGWPNVQILNSVANGSLPLQRLRK